MYNLEIENRNYLEQVQTENKKELNTVELKSAWKAYFGSFKKHCSEQNPCDGCRNEVTFVEIYGG